MSHYRFITAILFVSAFFLLGFFKLKLNINISDIGNYPQPLIEPLPINVAVYYGNDFRSYKTVQTNDHPEGFNKICNIQLGQANIALFDYILSNAFKNVTSFKSFPNQRVNLKNIDLLLEPKITDYTYKAVELAEPEASINITYEIKFYSPAGEQIGTWVISGKSYLPPRLHRDATTHLETWYQKEQWWIIRLTQLAMREVAARFLTDFCNQKDIQKLFYEQCNQ